MTCKNQRYSYEFTPMNFKAQVFENASMLA